MPEQDAIRRFNNDFVEDLLDAADASDAYAVVLIIEPDRLRLSHNLAQAEDRREVKPMLKDALLDVVERLKREGYL